MMPISPPEPPAKEEKFVKVTKLPRRNPQQPLVTTKPTQSSGVKKVRVSLRKKTASKPPVVVSRPTPTPKAESSKLPSSPKPPASPSPTPEPEPTNILVIFSRLAGAVPGCSNSKKDCWQVNETQWRSVASNLEQQFEQQGYRVDKLDDLEDEEGMGIYELTKPGTPPHYLHFLLTDQGTVYFLDSKRLSRGELEREIGV
ncbi:MAG: hypothetical protein K6T90_08365 [Leptolyngbyaceae cyanobacterium HOT.MB2.61]|nr:hypothetical protein [Leptolyngbyaceae cyanobacterium HOT.MB2.61]